MKTVKIIAHITTAIAGFIWATIGAAAVLFYPTELAEGSLEALLLFFGFATILFVVMVKLQDLRAYFLRMLE